MKYYLFPLLAIALLGFGCALLETVDQAEQPKNRVEPAPETGSQGLQASQNVPKPDDKGTPKPKPQEQTPPAAQPGSVDKDELVRLARLNNDFAFRLYNASLKEGKNLFFSPYSISTALSMTYGGARKQTADEMVKALSFELPAEIQHQAFGEMERLLNEIGKREKAQLSVANGVFQSSKYAHLLLPQYEKLVDKYYNGKVESLNFSDAPGTAKYINDWVLKRTNNRIKDLVSPKNIEDSNDGMVLVNAIFFKGNWKLQFDPKQTQEMPFYMKPGRNKDSSKPVKMMYRKGKFGYANIPGGQILELPYDEQDLAMIVMLPDENAKTPPSVELNSYYKWRDMLDYQDVYVYLPRFKLELNLDRLVDNLKAMGMVEAFTDLADFNGIRDPKGNAELYIEDVIHKAFIELTEEGTEAAAATAVIMATKSAAMPGDEPVTFMADHPFSYFIIHKPTGAVLFMGKFADPPKIEK